MISSRVNGTSDFCEIFDATDFCDEWLDADPMLIWLLLFTKLGASFNVLELDLMIG